jgi:hypothetical protein
MTLLKTIISSTIVFGILALHPSLNKGNSFVTQLQHYVNGNSLRVSTNSTIDKKLITIIWVCKVAADTCKPLTVFKDGKSVNKIPSNKGLQTLVVYYKNRMIGKLTQDKKTANQSHQYNIELLSEGHAFFFKGDITGPSSYHGVPITRASL